MPTMDLREFLNLTCWRVERSREVTLLGRAARFWPSNRQFQATFLSGSGCFTDASGSVTSIGTVDPQGVWQIQHRQFDEFGVLNFGSLDTTVSGDRNSLLDNVPPIWNGALQQELKGALDKVYLMNGRWFDEQLGRFLSEDPQGYGGGQTNLYVLNGNDPFATVSQTGIDWSKLEGPSPFNGLGAFGFGFYDAFAFGHFDDIIMADGVQQYAAQNGWYYAGMAFGVVSQIAIGNIAAGHLTAMSAASAAGTAAQVGAAARTATVAARAYQAYSLAGDAVGVYDSVDAYFSGEFSAMDLLGFAPTIGWASKGIDGLKSLGDIPGIRQAGTALLNDIRYAPRRGVLNLGAFDGNGPIRGLSVVERSGAGLSQHLPRTANLPSSARVADILENGWIPGRDGITVSDRYVRFSDLYAMSKKSGVEFGITRETINGQRAYRIYSGGGNSVRLPSGPGSRIIGHTHPQGSRYPSFGPFSDMDNINRSFLRSLQGNPAAPVPHRRVIWGEGLFDSTIYHPDILR